MKCICGYEQETPFEIYKLFSPVRPGVLKARCFENLFICPKCGTVKVEKEGEEE